MSSPASQKNHYSKSISTHNIYTFEHQLLDFYWEFLFRFLRYQVLQVQGFHAFCLVRFYTDRCGAGDFYRERQQIFGWY